MKTFKMKWYSSFLELLKDFIAISPDFVAISWAFKEHAY
jgi:hypothetical protein